jgi:uncharacterized protein
MERLRELIILVKPFYSSSDPSHDWGHVGRVASSSKQLCMDEEVDLECVLAAIYCHDLVNFPKDHPDRKKASTLSAETSRPLLKKVGFSDKEIKLIEDAVIEHSFSKGMKPSTLTSAIVQDADRLDALGAIGILRCAAVNTQMQSMFYDPFDPLAEIRELDDKKFMLDHYFVKLFKLPELMNTPKGKILAEDRVIMMKDFIQRLMLEIR